MLSGVTMAETFSFASCTFFFEGFTSLLGQVTVLLCSSYIRSNSEICFPFSAAWLSSQMVSWFRLNVRHCRGSGGVQPYGSDSSLVRRRLCQLSHRSCSPARRCPRSTWSLSSLGRAHRHLSTCSPDTNLDPSGCGVVDCNFIALPSIVWSACCTFLWFPMVFNVGALLGHYWELRVFSWRGALVKKDTIR